ncbi:hypothetical protein B0H17DRAFT_1130090 [Mycena rosella]|uniref:Uncharacterized protein n=1 Tax=Mycena rosella TaxID=1033263 RepID=A0AAD7GPH2_MYCRO|nr:hypothetical protein B0H17DRAFT_1130090 [Mycena rosella]
MSAVTSETPFQTAQTFSSTNSSSHGSKATNTIVAGILGLAGIAGVASLASWAHQVGQAKKASKPGSFLSKGHDFNFVIPPYIPGRPKRKIPKSYQITLTLTPVDIDEGYSYQQVVWQRFNINDGSPKFTARLDYDRAFGTANIRDGGDNINRVAFSDRPLSIRHAKSRGTTDNSEYVEARNSEEEDEEDRLFVPDLNQQVGFQSFIVMDESIGYAEQISASFDLILRVYKTQDVEVGQILSPAYVKHKAVPLLGEQGIRLSKLPKVATWLLVSDGSETVCDELDIREITSVQRTRSGNIVLHPATETCKPDT